MKNILYLLLSALSLSSLSAQDKQISYAIDHYLEVKDKIHKGDLFENSFRLNIGNLDWNESLEYRRDETYYFGVGPNQKTVLHLVHVELDSNDHHYQIEYLFDPQGSLIYSSEKQDIPKYHYRELKTFFKDLELIQLNEDNVTIKSSTIFHSRKVKYLLESAGYYQEKFSDYMGFESIPQ